MTTLATAAPQVPPPALGVTGYVYFLHYARPIGNGTPAGHAQHYTGFAELGRLDARLAEHRTGTGSKITAAFAAAGIDFVVARIECGVTRERERQIKRQGGLARRCPVCGRPPRPGQIRSAARRKEARDAALAQVLIQLRQRRLRAGSRAAGWPGGCPRLQGPRRPPAEISRRSMGSVHPQRQGRW